MEEEGVGMMMMMMEDGGRGIGIVFLGVNFVFFEFRCFVVW